MKITDLRTRIDNLDFRNCIIGIAETVMKRGWR